MRVLKKKVKLEEIINKEINHESNEVIVNNFLLLFGYYINNIEWLLNSDLSKMDNVSFIKVLNNLYEIELSERDYMKIYSDIYNKNYHGIQKIQTTMKHHVMREIGEGKEYTRYYEDVLISYYALVDEKTILDEKHRYTFNELKKMVDNKDILLLKENEEDILGKEHYLTEEYYFLGCYDLFESKYEGSAYFPYYVNFLKERFKDKRILNDTKEYLLEFKKQVSSILNNNSNINYQIVSQRIVDLLNESNVFKDYEKILLKVIKE